MFEILELIFGVSVGIMIGSWPVLKLIVPKLMDVGISKIEHLQNQQLKYLESRLELHSSTWLNSINVASRIEDSYRVRAIESTSTLWKEFLRIKNEFAPIVAIESFTTEKEFVSAICGTGEENEKISSIVSEYVPIESVTKKISGGDGKLPVGMEIAFGSGAGANGFDEERVFVSKSLFSVFKCMVRVHGRLGLLINQSTKSGKGKTWKSDPVMKQIVLDEYPPDVWEHVVKMEFGGLKALVGLLEQKFVLEAKKNMRGFEELADSVSEVGQIMQDEEVRVRLRGDLL